MNQTMISIVLVTLLVLLIFLMSNKMIIETEKITSFECGFSSMTPNRIPFSLRFFLLAILFLIFDVEIALLLPLPFSINNSYLLVVSSLFILMLTIGLFIEWNNNFLEWINWLNN